MRAIGYPGRVTRRATGRRSGQLPPLRPGGEAAGPPAAMPRYAQLVMGPAGSGKVRPGGGAGGGGEATAARSVGRSVPDGLRVLCRARTAPPWCSTARRWAAPCRW